MKTKYKRFSSLLLVGCLCALVGACGKSGDDDDDDTPVAGSSGSGGGVPMGSGGMAAGTGGKGPAGGTGGAAGTSGSGGKGMSGAGGMAGGGTGGGGEPEGDCSMAGPAKEGMCKDSRTGIFAIKTEVDVWWQDETAKKAGTPEIVDAGRNKITVYLMGSLEGTCEDGSNGVGIMKGCGTVLPAFSSGAACDAFQITFPDELWDKPEMPTFKTTGMTSGFNPGDLLSIATATGLIGIEMDDEAGKWPIPEDDGSGAPTTGSLTCKSGTGEKCFPDHDGDGKPGVTVVMGKIGETAEDLGVCNTITGDKYIFRGAPTDAINGVLDDSVRAVSMQIGLRTRIGGSGKIGDDCNSGAGDATVENLDSRVYSCQLSDGSDCGNNVTFIDQSAPIYHILNKGDKPPTDVKLPSGDSLDQTPSTGSHSSLVRLGDLKGSFTCADARAAAFPAFPTE